MDKAILKKFAIESRKDLMEKIKNKINTFYVDEEFKNEQKGELYILSNEKHSLSLTQEEYKKRELLIKRIKELSLEQVIEEAAYTWFNRIIAIRYMEINDMLPLTRDNQSLGIRVLSSKDNTPDPEILKFTNLMNPDLDIDFKKEKYAELKDDSEKFKYVLLLVCKKLGRVIPQVFDGVTDYIDILIPDNLLNDTGFVAKVINEVPESNYNQVEIIGWLYQYYNQAEKDRVISAKKAYKKNEIPYATQLFTPDWIVKYMVENSLGRYWVEHNGDRTLYPSNSLYPSSSITDNWTYFIKENIENKKDKLNPTEITFIDPCCGSGHILVYAFEVFYQIYLQAGYNKKDIPELILKNNLYGLDIDDRAGQLSILSVLLKARDYDKNIFNKTISRKINIMSIPEANNFNLCMIDNLKSNLTKNKAKKLLETFSNAKELGSLLILKDTDYTDLLKEIETDNTIFSIELKNIINPIIKVAEILNKKYDIIVTNPPYMNLTSMSDSLKKYVTDNYENEKYDLFSAFIKRISYFGKENSQIGLLTPYVWMFISSYQKLRKFLLNNCTITSLTQLEYNSFEAACVPVCIFTMENRLLKNYKGIYIKLSDFKGVDIQEIKTVYAIRNKKCNFKYLVNQNVFKSIPGNTITYWVSNKFIENFIKYPAIADKVQFKQGMATSNNKKFLRLWHEVDINNLDRSSRSLEEARKNGKKWFPYNKGGDFRKWYGNQDYVVNWYNDGKEMKEYTSKLPQGMNVRLKSREFYFLPELSWSSITTGPLSFRYYPFGFIFDTAGSCMFNVDDIGFYCGLMNSKIVNYTMKAINPTINNTLEDMKKIPVIDNKNNERISKLAKENIEISKEEWDSYESSMDFKCHPLIHFKGRNIKESYELWKVHCEKLFEKLKQNEIEINNLLISNYGLQSDLDGNVEDKDVTIRKADQEREIKSLISYAVGCMFGRYSLDKDGLIYAGGDFDKVYKKHKKDDGGWAGASLANYTVLNDNGKEIDLSFEVDNDNVIPITDEAYFGDDIVERFKKFISVVYGKETLNENLDFIAETLGKKGTETSEERIRRYFNESFFYDHCNDCSVTGSGKRPIYWLFDSGKKNGFKALIYMHRYNENLVPKIRLDYLHRMQATYEKLLSDINYKLTTELSMTDKKEAQKRQADLNAKLQEIKEYDEKIAYIANQRISINLDDGVKINYEKFKDVLAKMK